MIPNNQRVHTGDLYSPGDPELQKVQLACLDKLYDFNQTRPSEMDKRNKMLKEMFGDIGPKCYIEPPFHSSFAGLNVHFGEGVYANFNLTLVDDTNIYVGDYTMFGPNVTLATAGHPILAELRIKDYQYNAPIHIGKGCWLGTGVIVLPGVTIGDNVVVGAGAVVNKDLPDNVVAVGTPAHVLRKIGQHDREFYFKNRKIDPELLP